MRSRERAEFHTNLLIFSKNRQNESRSLFSLRLKDSPENSADQSADTGKTHTHSDEQSKLAQRLFGLSHYFFTADQSDQLCSDITANSLYSISHNAQRVAHKCPQCGKCYIYRSQVSACPPHASVEKCSTAFTVATVLNIVIL